MPRLLREDEMRHRLAAELRAALGPALVRVSLYGSRARGESLPASDWDVLVVTERRDPALKLKAAEVAERFEVDHLAAVSVRLLPADEFERFRGSGVAFWRRFARDEVVLWAPPT